MLFVDDIVLTDTAREGVKRKLKAWGKEMEDRRLRISRKETEVLCFDGGELRDSSLLGEKGEVSKTFKYLGSNIPYYD